MFTKSKKKYWLFFIIFLFFSFFPWMNAHAIEYRACEYSFTLWCGDTFITPGDPSKEICTAKVKFMVGSGAPLPTYDVYEIVPNADKKVTLDFFWNFKADLEKDVPLTNQDFENGCPDVYFVNTPAWWGTTKVIVRKELAGTLPTDKKYSEIERSVGRDLSVDLCSDDNYNKSYKSVSDKFTSIETALDQLNTESLSENPDNDKIIKNNESVQSDIDVLESDLEDVQKTYSECLENEPWSSYFEPESGVVITKLRELRQRQDDINKNIQSNENISEEAKDSSEALQNKIDQMYRDYESGIGSGDLSVDCGLLDPELVNTIQQIFDMVRLIVPIILILFGSMDFGKAVIVNDQEALKKAASSFLKRAAAAVIIFFLPAIIRYLLTLPGLNELVSDDPLCQIR